MIGNLPLPVAETGPALRAKGQEKRQNLLKSPSYSGNIPNKAGNLISTPDSQGD
jgi:hypothetical protein